MTVDTTNFEGWKKFRLGNLVEVNTSSINSGYGHKTIQYFDTSSITENVFDKPQLLSIDEAPSRARRIVKHGDTVISTVRPIQKHYGYIENPEPNAIVSTGFAVVSPKEVDSKFIYYYLTQEHITQYLNTIAESSTTTFPAFRPSDLMELEILAPSLCEQKRIGEILYASDAKIELNRMMKKKKKKMAQAIFKEWFVDFNFPGATGEFVDSALGPIPIGWEAKPLDKVAHFLNGLALQKYPPKNEADELPVIKIKQLRANSIDGADISSRSISKEYHVSFADLLFSWSGSLEVSFWTGPNGALNQHLFKVTSKEYPLWFCYHWLLHYLPAFRSIAEGKATTMGHIKRENLSNKYCPIPPNIEKLGKHIEAIHRKILANSKEANYLEKTKETLLGYFFELRNNDGI